MTRRSRRYFFWKKINKMIVTELSKNIQIEVDRMIMEQLLDLANSNVGDLLFEAHKDTEMSSNIGYKGRDKASNYTSIIK